MIQDAPYCMASDTKTYNVKVHKVYYFDEVFQQTVQQVKSQNAAFMQQLYIQQTEAEQQLQLAMQKAQTASEGIPDYKFQTIGLGGENAGQGIVRINPQTGEADQIFGGSPGGVTGKGSGITDWTHPDFDPNAV